MQFEALKIAVFRFFLTKAVLMLIVNIVNKV